MKYLAQIIAQFIQKHKHPPTQIFLTPFAALCLTVKYGKFYDKIGETSIVTRDFDPKDKNIESVGLGVFVNKGDLRAVDL